MNPTTIIERQAGSSTEGLRRRIKRLIDIGAAGAALVVLSPLFAGIAALIKLTSRGPVLYRWPVVGKGGRPLRAYKFRSMVLDADARKKDLLAMNESTGPVFKMKRDPRITPVGRFLRKYSLDELPQLWSVFKGDMSLVGPRPVLVTEWEQFTPWQKRKLDCQPGALCLWHVSGQPRDFDKWVSLDLEYAHNWSLKLDALILTRAVWYILSGKNC